MATKRQRQHRISELLEADAVTSQTLLVELLGAEGIEATQATVSRDLEELGAIKVRLPGGETAYVIPAQAPDQVLPQDHLRRVLGEWVGSVEASANIVVLRTPPGSAHVVASALDRASVDGVLGTVAGDDTLMVVARDGWAGDELAGRLRTLAGLD